MQGRFLTGSNEASPGGNIYADRSSIVLDWLLRYGVERKDFSLREVSGDGGVSLGLVHRVFRKLVLYGIMEVVGVRTAKRFSLKKPEALLRSWLERYSIVNKCKMRTYRSGLQRKECVEVLKKSRLRSKIALALHSAAEAHGYKNTNLNTLELYIVEPGTRGKLETMLELEPQESGYEVLLIEPYYKSMLKLGMQETELNVSPILLTFLDLYHFPLRGIEQSEFIAERESFLKRAYQKEK